MSNIYENAIEIYKQDANHYRDKYIDALHTISLKDEEIEGLKAECWCGCNDDLKAEYSNMKAEINTLIRSNNKRVDMIKELKAVNEDCVKTWSNENAELKAENDRLKADVKEHEKQYHLLASSRNNKVSKIERSS